MTEQTDIAKMQTDITWIKENNGKTFKAAMAVLVIGILAIFGAGVNVSKLNSHVESDAEKHFYIDKQILEFKQDLRDIARYKVMEQLGDVNAMDKLEEMREDFDNKRPPIYAGEPCEERT